MVLQLKRHREDSLMVEVWDGSKKRLFGMLPITFLKDDFDEDSPRVQDEVNSAYGDFVEVELKVSKP